MDSEKAQAGKGIYRYRCISKECGLWLVTFGPITDCPACRMPAIRMEFRPLGSEGEEEMIHEMAESVIDGFEILLEETE